MIRKLAPSRAGRRIAFWLYALGIATLTHWPGLAVEAPFELRADVLIHTAVFFLWTVLLVLAGYFGPVGSSRNATLAGLVGTAYAVVDELTQGIPAVRRTVDPLDLLANLVGVAVAILGFRLLLSRLGQADTTG